MMWTKAVISQAVVELRVSCLKRRLRIGAHRSVVRIKVHCLRPTQD